MKLGTVNKDDPKVVYVSGRCWLTPSVEINYKEAFEEVKKSVNKKIKSVICVNTRLSNKFIVNFDINPESFILNKKKYFAFDIFLRQEENNVRKLKSLIPEFEFNMNGICGEMVNELESFGFLIEMAA